MKFDEIPQLRNPDSKLPNLTTLILFEAFTEE